jgi:8-oxo-dGTP pyrophosphatase MutT (NUDIX family)
MNIKKDKVATRAGVLLLLYPNEKELFTVLMKRPEYLGAHSGQISFPGGKFEPADETIVNTALRETEEEIGVATSTIQVLGTLTPLYIPVSEFEVNPVVGFIHNTPRFIADPKEVKYIIEVSLDNLLNPAMKEEKQYTSGEYSGTVPYFNIRGNHVWGATAMILNEFLEMIGEMPG